jgi:hypothetical protein
VKINKRFGKIFTNKDLITSLLGSIIVVVFVLVSLLIKKNPLSYEVFFDIKTFVTLAVAFILNSLVIAITRHFRKKFEDPNKLIEDYNKLCSIYCREKLLVYENSTKADLQIGRDFSGINKDKDFEKDKYTFPAVDILRIKGKKLIINDDNEKMYSLPPFALSNMDQITTVHGFSKTYNNLMIRVEDIQENQDSVTISTSRTQYYYSLMTNRAMDYKYNDISIRDMYEQGPFLNSLSKSVLSNHLGFNGYVETSDEKFVFIFRHKKVSIGKNTMQNSVGASLKAKYALNNEHKLTIKGIENAIKEEIIDELRLNNIKGFNERKNNIFSAFSFENSVLYFYRDLVEGGKPQLMFYTQLHISSSELATTFYDKSKKRKNIKNKKKNKVDGYKLFFVDKDKMQDIYLAPNCIVINGKPYKCMPSVAATHIMMLEYMRNDS